MPLLDLKHAADYLAISTRSLERMVEREDIETVKLPGIRKTLFRTEDLERVIKENRIVPATVPAFGHSVSGSGGTRRRRA